MNELNLTFQIALGYLMQNSGVVISVMIAAVVLYGLMFSKKMGLMNAKCLKTAIFGGIGLWVFFILTLPSLTMSSLAQVTYSTDWFMLLFMSAGYAAIGAALLYPALRLMKKA